MVELTKQVFERSADIIKRQSQDALDTLKKIENLGMPKLTPEEIIRAENTELCSRFANYFKTTIPNFDTMRFINACEVRRNG